MKQKRSMLAVLVLCAIPSVAEANTGTPLLWAGLFHLVLGNLIIGLFEGLLLGLVFRLPKLKCIGLLILANYFSAWVGGLFIAKAIAGVLPMGIETAWPLLWVMVGITYLLTLLLEFPFVAFAFQRDPSSRRKSIRGSFLVQTVSYAILVGWYWLASGTSLYTRTEVVEISSISLPESVLVYFISVDDGDVYSGSLLDRKWQKVFDLDSSHRNDRLLVRPSVQDANSWDLIARLETDGRSQPVLVAVREQVASVAVPSWSSGSTDPPEYEGTWFNFGTVPKLGVAGSSSWEFWSGFWPIEGLRGTETKSGRRVWFSLETPYVAWSVRNATHLPKDQVLLQLGEDQICVYDPDKERIALLTKGRGPVAVMEEGESNEVIDGDEK